MHCRTFGGDGCASNCTSETAVPYPLVMGNIFDPNNTSTAIIKTDALNNLALALNGSLILTVGELRNNQVPVVIKASDITLDAVRVASLACACVRGIEGKSCGGTIFNLGGVDQTRDCSITDECAANLLPPCTALHGPGNTASGIVGCVSLDNTNYLFSQDAGGAPPPGTPTPVPPTPWANSGPPSITFSGTGGAGSAQLLNTLRIAPGIPQSAFFGNPCREGGTPGNPNYGPDKMFCTADDPEAGRGNPSNLPLVTGTATSQITNHYNSANMTTTTLGPLVRTGSPFSCAALTAPTPSASGAQLVGGFTSLNQATLGDLVVVTGLLSQ